ncbi:Unknown protein, partial [Striga hermonthica]
RIIRLKLTHNPPGTFKEDRRWTSAEDQLFKKMAVIELKLQEEIHLAAYLSCWICTFVLPKGDVDIIRPGTFKMASMMAKGCIVGLAVPVLTSIYKGLNELTSCKSPSRSTFLVHFDYSWLALYFKTHFTIGQTHKPLMVTYSGENGARHFVPEEARRRIHKGDFASWTCNIIIKNQTSRYVDDQRRPRYEWRYFTAIRSNYLTWRQGNRFFIEPYSPHRFSRQFGFYQDVPGTLKKDFREGSLDNGIYYWQQSVLCGSSSKASLPCVSPDPKKSTQAYKSWWQQVHRGYLERHIEDLLASKPNMISSRGKEPVVDQGDSTSGDHEALLARVVFSLLRLYHHIINIAFDVLVEYVIKHFLHCPLICHQPLQPGGEVEEIQMIEGCEDRKFRIGKDLEEPIRSRLIDLVREFADIFAYTAEVLTGISAEVIEHRLNIDLSVRPVKQKRRHHGAEMDKIIEQEVEKLLGAGHIEEIQFPEWLSNTVMVSKSEGKWRMCIDFRDLNKACPKDLYPLPRIDQLVDSTAGCELLSLMDASQGYHQIPLAREDRKRVSFVTSRGTYCYVVMPFGLKNAGATYQRLVDKIFKEQLGRNMEVYVDDMLVKSKEELDHVRDLKETFLTLRRYGMKLNPAKCSFGVRSGKFLGYLVTRRGIEVNPEKLRAVIEMQPPTKVKEVQILTGRIAGLSRFISKVAEKSGPLFKTLPKSSKFQWTEEAQRAFEELKRMLVDLPLLAKPLQGEDLVLYVSIGEAAVSSVLLREEGAAQFPIYYVSKVMQGAERRYSEIEKGALEVVVTVRKLRPYFLEHRVKVRTNMPLGETLGRPSVSGRLVKWAVELSEYTIIYEPRRAIKAQALADFIQEGTKEGEELEGVWQVFADGS